MVFLPDISSAILVEFLKDDTLVGIEFSPIAQVGLVVRYMRRRELFLPFLLLKKITATTGNERSASSLCSFPVGRRPEYGF